LPDIFVQQTQAGKNDAKWQQNISNVYKMYQMLMQYVYRIFPVKGFPKDTKSWQFWCANIPRLATQPRAVLVRLFSAMKKASTKFCNNAKILIIYITYITSHCSFSNDGI
jgi:hypothetical protein